MANNMPPIPRDHDEASFSEIVPLRSGKINLLKSPLLIFGVASSIIGVLLFFQFIEFKQATTGPARGAAFMGMIQAIAFYLLMVVLVVLLIYSRSDRSVLYYVFPTLIVTLIFLTPLRQVYFFIFREILPGNMQMIQSKSFVNSFIGMFFGAGLCEELWKATPVLIGAALTLFAARLRANLPAKVFDFLRVRGPLDAILMGLAAGATFIFWETVFEYVPRTVVQTARAGDAAGAFGTGLMLLMPRVIGGLAGHMGYAGIFAYFIGLAVIRPKHAPKLIAIGWLTSSILHGLWNSVAHISPYLWYAVAGATAILLIACLLKARQLEASIFGRSGDTFGSIVVGMPGAGFVPSPAAPPQWGAPAPVPVPGHAPQWGTRSPAPGHAPQWGAPAAYPGAPQAGPPVAFPGGPPVAQPPYPSPPGAATALIQPTMPVGTALSLAIAGTNVPLMPGARLDLGMIPALGERGRGLVGEVSVHPRNPGVIGLKNVGTVTWYARLRDGSVQPVEPQRNVRLAGGISIDFGGGIQGAVVG